jgi:hypothetical protein
VIAHVITYIAKSIGADANAGMQNYAIANRYIVIKNYAGMKYAVATYCNVIANNYAGLKACARSDSGAFPYCNMRADVNSQIDIGAGRDYCR